MTYKPEGYDAIKALLEQAQTGLLLHQIISETKLDADTVLKALSALGAGQDGQKWSLHVMINENSNQPMYLILKCIRDSGNKGVSFEDIINNTGLTRRQIDNALQYISRKNIQITKTTVEGTIYFTFLDRVLIRPKTSTPAPAPAPAPAPSSCSCKYLTFSGSYGIQKMGS